MFKFIFVLLLASLLGCASNAPLPRTMERHRVTITWVKTTADIRTLFNCDNKDALGCAQYVEKDDSNECIIYAPEPTDASYSNFQFHILGHEMLHCFIGTFHD